MKRFLLSVVIGIACTSLLNAKSLSGVVKDHKTGEPLMMDIVALIKSCKLSCRCTYYLENNCDRALFSVIVSDSERNTLALLINSVDDELTSLSLSGNVRCVDLHKNNSVVELSSCYDFVH